MTRSLLLIFALFLAVVAGPAKAGFIGSSSVVGYDVGDSALLIIRTEVATGCGTNLAYVSRTDPWYEDMLAMVISAYNGGTPVNIYIGGCNAAGYGHAVRMVQGSVW